jgi:cytochrome c biogenesis protein CcmG, thiol:disulfide interchange protein DsbE
MSRKPRSWPFWALTLAIACLGASAGCGADDDGASKPPDYDRALAGAPAPLAQLHEQANELLEGGADAFERRIAQLRGYPVVVNQWASWCGPCRLEFPYFQRLSARYGKRVAFLGVDSQDSDDAARTFLSEEPVPYPSYVDPDKEIGAVLKATRGLPDTSYYSATGELVYTKQGPYTSQEELEADIKRYALASSPPGGG